MTSPSPTQQNHAYPRELPWSRSERAVARTAFDTALGRELQEVMAQAKAMATHINEPSELWKLEHYLTQRRNEINRKYDYRYSQLTHVFGRLLQEGRLSEEELRGLGEDKMKLIRSFAKFLAEMDAT